MRKLLNNKKGSALATTVLVLAVIILLTSALLTMVTYALRQSYKSSMRQQAYFTARSAAIELKDYLDGDNHDGPNGESIVYTGFQEKWSATATLQDMTDTVDSTVGTATLRLEKISGKKWRIVSVGEYMGETNTAVVYLVDDYEREPLKANNRNMIIASSINDGFSGAPQYFTSSTFNPIDAGRSRESITKMDYTNYISNYQGIEDHMTHLYSKKGTSLDLQNSYYSGYIISETDFTLKGVGATCYGIRTLGDLNIPAGGGSSLYVYGDVYVGGNINIKSNNQLRIYGDVYCGGDAYMENIYVYGDIYCCGTEVNNNGTITYTGGKYSAIDGGDEGVNNQMLGEAYCREYSRINGDTYSSGYNAYIGRVHQEPLNSAVLVNARNKLAEKLQEDVYGKSAYVEVLKDKTDYLESLPEVVWTSDHASRSHIISSSGYINQNTLNNMRASGSNYTLIINASKSDIDIYLRPGTSIGSPEGTNGASTIQPGFTNQPFNWIGYYGDYAVRFFLGENTKFCMRNTTLGKVTMLNAGNNHFYVPKTRDKDTSYVEPDPNDEPNFYLLSNRNNVDVRIHFSNFYGYIIMPNTEVYTYDRDANGTILLNQDGSKRENKFTGNDVTSRVRINVGYGSNFYGSVYADKFIFIDSGTKDNSKYYFIPPTETKFFANLANWMRVTDPEGKDSSWGGGMQATPFTAAAIYTHGTTINSTKMGKTSQEQHGGTTYFRFDD